MEDVIRSRFDGGLLGTTHSAYKRLVKRFSASLNGQGLDSQALLKELSAFETNLLVSELARRRCAEKLKAGEGLEKELEEAREDLEVKSAELLVRASKRKKVEKVSDWVKGYQVLVELQLHHTVLGVFCGVLFHVVVLIAALTATK